MLISLPFSDCNEKKQLYRLAQIFLRPNFLNGCIIYDSACWLQKVTWLTHHKQVIHHPEYCGVNLLFHISWFAINIKSFSPSFVSDTKPQRYCWNSTVDMCIDVSVCTLLNSQCTVVFLIASVLLFQASCSPCSFMKFSRLLLKCLPCRMPSWPVAYSYRFVYTLLFLSVVLP